VRLPARNPAQSTANADSTGRGPLKQIRQHSSGGFLANTALLKIAGSFDNRKECVGFTAIPFFQVASLVMLLVAVALLAAIATMHFAIHGAEVQVPALKGMTVAEARSQTSGLGLNLDVDNRYYSGDVAAGTYSYAVARAGNGGAAGVARARL
jgi:hypothetical protein